MNFTEAEIYLLSLGNEVMTMKLGLENISKLLAALGDPQKNYLKVQVAGTNGKGSVCAFINAICVSAGIRTGMFTSPHLISVSERVQLDGVPISEIEFANYATQVRATADRLVSDGALETIPTFFEQITAIALVAFGDLGVDLAILETGLGGRLDATTAANAEIDVITRIDYDHQEYLGETVEEIAAEKAAIIQPNSQVVIGEQSSQAMKVILDRCTAFGIEPKMGELVRAATSRDNSQLRFETAMDAYTVDKLGLAGRHQIENAKSAILAAELLASSYPITRQNIVEGVKSARHPGRLERVSRYLLDGAHNLGGARALSAFLDDEIRAPVTMVFGIMRDKDLGEIARELFPKAKNVILTEAKNSRSMKATELAKRLPDDLRAKIFQTDSVNDALRLAEEISSPKSIILVTGSLYLVGEAKQVLQHREANLKYEVSNLR